MRSEKSPRLGHSARTARFRALKLWFLIREQGISGLQARIRRDIANARWFADQVDATPNWKRVAPALRRPCACVTSHPA